MSHSQKALVILFAFALRVLHLETQGIWGDEAFSIYTAKQSIEYVISGGADTHPPLYHFILHFWMLIAGRTPFAVRYLSVFWSALTVAACYALASRMVRPRLRGAVRHGSTRVIPLMAALLAALSPFQVFYAQEVRMYAQTAALCALSLLYFVRWQMPPRTQAASRNPQLIWFISTLLAIYSHYFAFFILAAQNLFVIWQWRRGGRQSASSIRSFLAAQAGMAILYLPWVWAQIGYLANRANTRAGVLSLEGIWSVASKSLGAFYIGATVDGVLQVSLASLSLALALIGYFANRQSPIANLSLLSVVVPILGAVVVNPLLPFFRERFLLLSSAPFLVLMAQGAGQVAWWASRKARRFDEVRRLLSLSFVAVAALSAAVALGNYWLLPQYRKGEYHLAIQTIRSNARPSDAVIIYSPIQDAVYDYYRIENLKRYTLPGADLALVASNHARAWLLLYGDPAVYDPNQSAEQFLSRHGFKSLYQSYRDGALARYDFAREAVALVGAQIRFGESITLDGYALPPVVARGETLPVVLQWQTRAPLAENYTVFAHLLDTGGKVVAQMDTQPVGGTRPTKTWRAGEGIRDNVGVTIPADLRPGRYRVEVGMYAFPTLARLAVREAGSLPVQDNAVIIGELEIK